MANSKAYYEEEGGDVLSKAYTWAHLDVGARLTPLGLVGVRALRNAVGRVDCDPLDGGSNREGSIATNPTRGHKQGVLGKLSRRLVQRMAFKATANDSVHRCQRQHCKVYVPTCDYPASPALS